MSHIAIGVSNLSKRYRIGVKDIRRNTLAGSLMDLARQPLRNLRRLRRMTSFSPDSEENDVIWALNDVSFEVNNGEVVGVIGHNGAGKSTLLKVLSRITHPTSGRIELNGRVSSLLEVGTGFHPELTGRENVYLNGTIMGMRKAEIDKKFDEIVDFSGVEKFIDTPVKHYSSGMRVRLAFSVAAHLEPEIMLIDEVLAVGDAEFQKKCLGKMGDIGKDGRTILFVSHNIPAVIHLCSRSLLFRGGRLVSDGDTEFIVNQYVDTNIDKNGFENLIIHTGRSDDSVPILQSIAILDETGSTTDSIRMGQSFSIEISYSSNSPVSFPRCGLGIINSLGVRILSYATFYDSHYYAPEASSSGKLTCRVDSCNLVPGVYSITITLSDSHNDLDRIEGALKFSVLPWDVYSTGVIPKPHQGLIWVQNQQWEYLDQ